MARGPCLIHIEDVGDTQRLYLAVVTNEAWEETMSSMRRMGHRCALSLLLVASTSVAQAMTCGVAVAQLQSYVAQVNSFANVEYYQNIPMRCAGNPACMQWWLGQLNGWYVQQSGLVNGWYAQLSRQCSQQPSPGRIRTTPQTTSGPGELDESAVEELTVDDEDRTVAIRIPSTPKGFR